MKEKTMADYKFFVDERHLNKIKILSDINGKVEKIIAYMVSGETQLVIEEVQDLNKNYPLKSDLMSVIKVIDREIIQKKNFYFESEYPEPILTSIDIACLIIHEVYGDNFINGYEIKNELVILF